jgi:hypothetical protein
MSDVGFIPVAPGSKGSAAGQAPNAARKARRRAKWIRTKYGRMAVPYEVWAGIVR